MGGPQMGQGQAAAKEFGVPAACPKQLHPWPRTVSLGSCGSSGVLRARASVLCSSQDGFETFQTAGKFRGNMQETGGAALGITTGSVLCPDRSKCLPGLMQAFHVCACTSMDTHSRGVDILEEVRKQVPNGHPACPRRPSILLRPLSTPLILTPGFVDGLRIDLFSNCACGVCSPERPGP